MPAQRNTMSYEWNVMSFCSYFLKQLFSQLPLGSLNAFVSWARYRKGMQKAKLWALLFWDSLEQVFFPMHLLVFLLQESGPVGQKSMSPWNAVMSSWKTRWVNSPTRSVSSEHLVQLDHLGWPKVTLLSVSMGLGSRETMTVGQILTDRVSKGVICSRKQHGLCLLEEERAQLCHPRSGSACGLAI